MTHPDDEVEAENEKCRTGSFQLPHRGGNRVEVGDPIKLPDARGKPWMCAVKLVGPKEPEEEEDPEFTQTLLVRTGRGNTPEEAQRDAMAQLSIVYGTPTQPPPPVLILRKPSVAPPEGASKKGVWTWVKALFGRGSKA